MWRLLMAMALAAVVLSAVTASAALLEVDGGTLQVFTYPVDIEVPPPIDDCDDNCGEIESIAEDGENPGEDLLTEYEIRPGDTLWAIAIRFGTTVEELVRLNQLRNPNLIFYGSTLNVPYVGEELGDAPADVSPQSRRASVRLSGQ
jgi:nucleoid-associated protein YgaU